MVPMGFDVKYHRVFRRHRSLNSFNNGFSLSSIFLSVLVSSEPFSDNLFVDNALNKL